MQLVSTLLEETLHLTHGFHDESRQFQDYLLTQLVTAKLDQHFTMPLELDECQTIPQELEECPTPLSSLDLPF
jgi:hypothetical protein